MQLGALSSPGEDMDEGRQAQFARLWQDHGPAIGRVVASYARPGADQADLAQDIALALWTAFPRFRGQSSEKTFLLRIAHNQALRHVFNRRTDGEVDAELADPHPRPDQQASARQEVQQLFRHVRRMPLLQREILGLALEDLTHAEIGEALGITPGNVAVRVNRARAALRDLMKENCHE
jgi:RNA polymerase sigma factor (sigma-70 family)